MADYDLNRLGSAAFEQLVAVICVRALGAGIEFFGRGRDGGREATFSGPIDWSATAEAADLRWDGLTVIQAKFCEEPSARPHENAAWLWQQLRKEIDAWKLRAADGHQVPTNLLFATNVRLSAVARTGGIDRLNENLRRHIEGRPADGSRAEIQPLHGVEAWRLWHADQIRLYLDSYPEIRSSFPAFLTIGDVLSGVAGLTQGVDHLAGPMRLHAVQGLTNERWIRLSESGSATGEKTSIEEVAIDLPASVAIDLGGGRSGHSEVAAAQHIIDSGDRVLRPSLIPAIEPRHFVILGGPGQGKTTLSLLVAQAYRAAILQGGEVSSDTAPLLQRSIEKFDGIGLSRPGNRRWPMRVDLAEYGEAISGGNDLSILRWLAQRVSARISVDITPSQLRSWLRAWPWVLILDGLDEVTAPTVRDDLLRAVEDFRVEASEVDADLMIVATSRPLGYDAAFDHRFTELHLNRLSVRTAMRYASTLLHARHREDPDLLERTTKRFREAAEDESRRRLMETPLQVTIMAFILERFPLLPPDRYSLFSRYYDTMYARESAKKTHLAKLLVDQRMDVEFLHEQAALQLQTAAEASGVDATMTTQALGEIIVRRSLGAGYSAEEADRRASELVRAATHRLVLLTPQGGEVGFELRTLQELMAARALTNGRDDVILDRLLRTAYSPHWRNTWLLAVGRLLAERDYLTQDVVAILDRVDSDPRRFGRLFPVAPELVAEMLNDRLALNRPAVRRNLVLRMLEFLGAPPQVYYEVYAAAIVASMDDSAQSDAILSRLKAAADGNLRDKVSVLMLVDAVQEVASRIEYAAHFSGIRRNLESSLPHDLVQGLWNGQGLLFAAALAQAEMHGKRLSLAQYLEPMFAQNRLVLRNLMGDRILPGLDNIWLNERDGTYIADPLSGVFLGPIVLADEETATAVEMIFASISAEDWAVSGLLQFVIKSRLGRLPVQLPPPGE